MKKTADEEAGDGPVSDSDEEETEEEKARNKILAQIVEGWGSKGGSEDIRVRGSALSVLAIGIDTNIGGLGPTLVSGAVDLCLHILTMEPELEKGILRRPAVILILSFVKALHKAKVDKKRLGFGLTEASQGDIVRILKYIASTDNDGLVKEHAQDVVESLENWRMSSIVSEVQSPEATLTGLAGLSVNPGMSTGPTGNARPRIEEID